MVTEKDCMNFLMMQFPDFEPYWIDFLEEWGDDQGLTINLLPFGDYTLDQLRQPNNEIQINKIFDQIEFLLTNGDDRVQTAIATGPLEYIQSMCFRDPTIQDFTPYLRKESLAYLKAWDKMWEDPAIENN